MSDPQSARLRRHNNPAAVAAHLRHLRQIFFPTLFAGATAVDAYKASGQERTVCG